MALNLKTNESQQLDHHGKCPECGVSWDAGSIFDALRPQEWCANKTDAELQKYIEQYYSPPYRFSRIIGVEIAEIYDGVAKWRCPDCGAEWARFHK